MYSIVVCLEASASVAQAAVASMAAAVRGSGVRPKVVQKVVPTEV